MYLLTQETAASQLLETRRDPLLLHQRQAVEFLMQAQKTRIAYDDCLQAAIQRYGDRHTPIKLSVYDPCKVCTAHGVEHSRHEALNHQTGQIIAGIYADHFPDATKAQLRRYLAVLNLCNANAHSSWHKSGRRVATLLPLSKMARRLSDNRVSYY